MSTILALQIELNVYFITIVYFTGTVTNLLNIIVFRRRTFRMNCCSWYFICLSLSQILLLHITCLLPLIISWTDYNGFSSVDSLCKIRTYVSVFSLVLFRHLICTISIDRWVATSSSACFRKQNSPRNTRWTLVTSILLWSLLSIHVLCTYTAKGTSCSPISDTTYEIFLICYSIITSNGSFCIAMIFSTLTVMNIRQIRRQTDTTLPTTTASTNAVLSATLTRVRLTRAYKRNRRNRHFIRLAVFQTVLYLIFNFLSSFSPLLLCFNSLFHSQTAAIPSFITSVHLIGCYLFYLYISVSAHENNKEINKSS
ncbi:unnamed protein product [Adineta ricciae]|uniref:G-protein coupled receptors family 1 profile domain-containing protein n=1 Tax=Adineta ricciae TaxID=249248 RepID=A0A814TFP6_ADIRI|nr:unnamed protein product [Adineta ricciae]CAF1161119.1 unnamed protein product [Adineta ricciae]